jgi:hypothetical protein
MIEGSLCRKTFLDLLRDSVVCPCLSPFRSGPNHILSKMPLTTPYPGPRSILILDNARIHHGSEVEELANQYSGSYSVVLEPADHRMLRCTVYGSNISLPTRLI